LTWALQGHYEAGISFLLDETGGLTVYTTALAVARRRHRLPPPAIPLPADDPGRHGVGGAHRPDWPHYRWLDAFFTATSAVCVTGLVVVDITTQFTVPAR
jgi:hypothetical protein